MRQLLVMLRCVTYHTAPTLFVSDFATANGVVLRHLRMGTFVIFSVKPRAFIVRRGYLLAVFSCLEV